MSGNLGNVLGYRLRARQTSQGDWGMSQKQGLGALAPGGTRTWGSASASATPTEDQPAGVPG